MRMAVTPANVVRSLGDTPMSNPAMRCERRARQPNAVRAPVPAEYALAQNHPEDIVLLRAQGKANGDLARLLIDEIGDGAVDSQTRQKQCSCGKQCHHLHGEPPHGKRRREDVVQGLRVEDGQLRIDRLDLRAHLRGDGGGIDLSAQKERQIFYEALLVDVEVNLRNAGIRERFRTRIGDDADDGGPVWLVGAQTDTLANSDPDRATMCARRPD